MAVANVGWDLAGAAPAARFVARARLAGPGAQRAALLGAVDAAGAAHARIRPGGARDLGGWKGDGKLDYEGKHYRFTLMTPELRARAL